MESQELSLDHKQLLFERLKNLNTGLAEYSFSNLFLFRKIHNYHVLLDRHILIQGISYDGKSYLMPTSDIRNMDKKYIESLLEHTDMLFPIPEEWITSFDESMVTITSMDGDTDYIYTVEKMRTYKGRKLHRKRNLLKNFLSNNRVTALPLTRDRIPDAEHILDAWQKESGSSSSDTDYFPCREALSLYEELVLCGGIYYANDEPAGFLIGEELRANTFALHFAKAKKIFSGIYQYMFNNFAGVLPSQYIYLNLEQDLGMETLRASKSSYIPDMKLKKYRISKKV